MNKEQLIALGLTEEQADKVVAGIGTMIPKSRFDDINDAKKQLDIDLAARDKQLEDLKKVDAEGLQAEITRLQGENVTSKADYESKIQKQSYEFALERALTDAKVKNPKAVKALLNTEAIKLDGEKLLGLDEQLKTLSESDGYLFAQDSEGKPVFKGFTPMDGKQQINTEPKAGDYGKQMAEGLAKSNEGLEDARKSYFE
ncbi:phage scaffolding protein [Sporosarcina sp. FSL K6-1540]|uniref:phage scaffolding protein n=1 Tax=Sporosarcina sp. FSL K6-1540 TaxID=2921555 RepID=UPI00315A64E5